MGSVRNRKKLNRVAAGEILNILVVAVVVVGGGGTIESTNNTKTEPNYAREDVSGLIGPLKGEQSRNKIEPAESERNDKLRSHEARRSEKKERIGESIVISILIVLFGWYWKRKATDSGKKGEGGESKNVKIKSLKKGHLPRYEFCDC